MRNRTGAIEFKDIPATDMRTTNDRQGIIEGLVSKTGNIDLQDDRVMHGAWRDTIKSAYARKAAGDPYLVPFLWSHNHDALPPGGVFYLDETRDGLFAKIQMNLGIQSGKELYESYARGTVSKQSIGYRAITSDYERIEGKQIRNLRACELLECSGVIFAANPQAVVTAVKRGDYSMFQTKDFDARYAAQQLDDWQYSDWGDLSTALQQAVQDCFAPGSDPLAALERDILPGLAVALRAYVSAGIALGYSTAPASASDVYSMGMAGSGESKSGYLSAQHHATIKEASANIMKSARAIAKVSDALEASRRNALQGFPIARSTSSAPMTYLEQKEAEEEQHSVLKRLADELEISNNMRELRELSSELGSLQLKQVTANKRG